MPIVIPPPLDDAIQADHVAVAAMEEIYVFGRTNFVQHRRVASQNPQGNGKPPNEPIAMAELALMNNAFDFEREIDEYAGPKGIGYVVHYFWTVGQQKYHVAYNHGPEDWRSSGPSEFNENE